MKNTLIPIMATIFLVLCGCGVSKDYSLNRINANMFQVAQQQIKAQLSNPQAAAHPPANSAKEMDGYAGVNTIGAYRNAFSTITKPQAVTINVGSVGGSQ
jgi:hypothetical protein